MAVLTIDPKTDLPTMEIVDTEGYGKDNRPVELCCRIGDRRFLRLLELVKDRRNHRIEYEEARLEKEFPNGKWEEILAAKCKHPDQRHIRGLLAVINGTIGLDYSDAIKEQLLYFNQYITFSDIVLSHEQTEEFKNAFEKRKDGTIFPPLTSFRDLPFSIYDSHINAYYSIARYLYKTKKKVTIVRFDAHNDCKFHGAGPLDRANYFSILLLDKNLASKIKEVISVGALFQGAYELRYAPDYCSRNK